MILFFQNMNGQMLLKIIGKVTFLLLNWRSNLKQLLFSYVVTKW